MDNPKNQISFEFFLNKFSIFFFFDKNKKKKKKLLFLKYQLYHEIYFYHKIRPYLLLPSQIFLI